MKSVKEKQEHNMILEIREQTRIIEKIIDKYADCGKRTVSINELDILKHKIKVCQKIIFVACGTSYYAGIYGKYIFEEIAEIDCSVEYADEFNSREVVINDNTIVVAMSQSGETSDVLTAAKKAKSKGATVIGITNGVDSSLSKLSRATIYNDAGEEKALAATKSYTSQLTLLYLISIYFAGINSAIKNEDIDVIYSDLSKLSGKITDTLSLEEQIEKVAASYASTDNLIVLGGKYNYLTALEGAHKLKETTYIHAEGASSEEFIHGPNAIIDANFPSIFISPKDSIYEDNLTVYKKINSEGAANLILTTTNNNDFKDNEVLYLPEVSESLSPILYVIPLQIFAYYLAGSKNINVDNLRNISKFVVK